MASAEHPCWLYDKDFGDAIKKAGGLHYLLGGVCEGEGAPELFDIIGEICFKCGKTCPYLMERINRRLIDLQDEVVPLDLEFIATIERELLSGFVL